jgi:hypothetical protein
VRLLARPSFQSYWAVVRGVSARSIGLAIAQRFEPGAVLAIQMQRKRAGVSDILSAKVRQVFPAPTVAPSGGWLLDCSLSRCLTEEELEAILQGQSATLDADR